MMNQSLLVVLSDLKRCSCSVFIPRTKALERVSVYRGMSQWMTEMIRNTSNAPLIDPMIDTCSRETFNDTSYSHSTVLVAGKEDDHFYCTLQMTRWEGCKANVAHNSRFGLGSSNAR
jgi:hypothetical protein